MKLDWSKSCYLEYAGRRINLKKRSFAALDSNTRACRLTAKDAAGKAHYEIVCFSGVEPRPLMARLICEARASLRDRVSGVRP